MISILIDIYLVVAIFLYILMLIEDWTAPDSPTRTASFSRQRVPAKNKMLTSIFWPIIALTGVLYILFFIWHFIVSWIEYWLEKD